MKRVHLKMLLLLIVVAVNSKAAKAQCRADFSYSQNGFVVQFMDMSATSAGSIVQYFWSFGNGTTSTLKDPVHSYSAPGAYQVMHSVQNSAGTCSDTIIRIVFISPPAQQQVEVCANAPLTSLQSWRQANTYQWQVSTDSIHYSNITPSAYYSGINTSVLNLHNLPTSFTGYQYRCLADTTYSTIYSLRFTNYFTGSNTSWTTPANWSCGSVPDMFTDVIIPSGQVVISANTTIRSLEVKPGGSVNVLPGVVLTVVR